MTDAASSEQPTAEAPRRHLGLTVVLCLISWLLLGVGVLSPLTPSEGRPGATEMVVFAVLPVALQLLAARITGSFLLRVAVLLQVLLQLGLLFVVLEASFAMPASPESSPTPSPIPSTTLRFQLIPVPGPPHPFLRYGRRFSRASHKLRRLTPACSGLAPLRCARP